MTDFYLRDEIKTGGDKLKGLSQDELLSKYITFCKEHNINQDDYDAFFDTLMKDIEAFFEKHGISMEEDTYFENLTSNDPLYDEISAFFDLTVAESLHGSDWKNLGDFYRVLGGRYDDIKVGDSDLTVRDVGQFKNFIDSIRFTKSNNDGFPSFSCAAEEIASHTNFNLDDIRTFREASSYHILTETTNDRELMIERPHKLLAEIMFVKATREAESGKHDLLTEDELSLIVSHIDAEYIMDNPTLSKLIISTFEDALNGREDLRYSSFNRLKDDSPKKPGEHETSAPFLSDVVKAIMLKNRDYLDMPKEKIQAWGESILKKYRFGYDDAVADGIEFAVGLGCNMGAVSGAKLFESRHILPELQERGLIGPEEVDVLYQYVFDQMRETQKTDEGGNGEKISPLYINTELVPSESNVVANFWRNNHEYLSGYQFRERFMEGIDPNTCLPVDNFIEEIIIDNRQSLSQEDAAFIVKNYDLLLAPHAGHLKELPLFSGQRLSSDWMKDLFLRLPKEAQGELSSVVASVLERDDFAFVAQVDNTVLEQCHLSPTQLAIVLELKKLGEEDKKQRTKLIQFMIEKVPCPTKPVQMVSRYKTLTPESVASTNEVLSKIYKSSATELTSHSDEIVTRLLQFDHERASQNAERLERIYLRSDIPEFAKLYCTANLLYEDSIENDPTISPVLFESDDRRSVLMTDLLKNAIRSGNPSLRRYLEYHLSLTDEKYSGENDDEFLGEFSDNKKFHTRFLGYARALGYESTREILSAMDESREIAHRRHLDSVECGIDGVYRLKRNPTPGDFIKGINIRYIHTMMRNGFNCPEMVGSGAYQDATHWDTDFGSFREGTTLNYDRAISGSMANGYGWDGVFVGVFDDERFCHLMPGDTTPYDDMKRYEVYHNPNNLDESFRGIRTGLGSFDVDFFVVSGDAQYQKRLAYEIVKSGCYTPIIDRTSGNVVFTSEDFANMRERFRGQPRYSEDQFVYATDLSLPDTLRVGEGDTSMGFADLVDNYEEREKESRMMDRAISDAIIARVEKSDLPEAVKNIFRNQRSSIDPDYKAGYLEVLSTGSTARFTNMPGAADYDYIWRIDRDVYEEYGEQIMSLLDGGNPPLIEYNETDPDSHRSGLNIRKGIMNVGDKSIEIDISPTIKTNSLEYSSDIALADQLRHMKRDNPESYRAVIANIILAKAFLKKAGAYKKHSYAAHSQGGLGGIGVENWILQNGGSLKTALGTFLAASTHEDGTDCGWGEFSKKYAVWDFGENHLSYDNYPYDEFVYKNMDEGGYERMLDAAKRFMASLE